MIPNKTLKISRIVILFTIVSLLILVFIVRFPEIVNGEIQLSTINPPIKIYPKKNGRIEQLFKTEGDSIQAGEIISVIKSTAHYNDILTIEKKLSKLVLQKSNYDVKDIFDLSIELGDAQLDYISFLEELRNYEFYQKELTSIVKKKHISSQISSVSNKERNLLRKKNTLKKELKNVEKNYNRSKELLKKGVISNLDLEKEEIIYFQHQQKINQVEIEISNNIVYEKQLREKITDNRSNRIERLHFIQLNLLKSIKTLQTRIKQWKDDYIIISPISGIVSMNDFRGNNEYIDQSRPLCTVIPIEFKKEVLAVCTVPIHNSGKITKTSVVNIKLDNFPSKEYGVLSGRIKNIYLTPESKSYKINILINLPLNTSYDIQIPFKYGLTGKVEIVLENRNLIQKFIYEIKNSIMNP